MFYVYVVDNKFVTIKENRKGDKLYSIGLTKSIEKSAYFINKKNVNSWENTIKFVYPNAEIKEATLTLK